MPSAPSPALCCLVQVDSPAWEAGVRPGDVLVAVGEQLVTQLSHAEAVAAVQAVEGNRLELTLQRGDHIVPNLAECFPVHQEEEEELHNYFARAAKAGVGCRLVPKV